LDDDLVFVPREDLRKKAERKFGRPVYTAAEVEELVKTPELLIEVHLAKKEAGGVVISAGETGELFGENNE
jgi:hypothetical protein